MVEDRPDRDTEGAVAALTLPPGELLILTRVRADLVALTIGAHRPAVPSDLL